MPDSTLPTLDERDAGITINSYTTLRRRPNVSDEDFHEYWANVHGPLCSRIPGLGYYVQNHFTRLADSHGWPLADGASAHPDYVLDGAVEIGWVDESQQRVFQGASPLLFSDELNFIGWDVAYALPHGSTTLVDRSVHPTPNGDDLDRVHVHFTARSGRRDDLVTHLRGLVTKLAETSDSLIRARLHAPEPYDNHTPNPPAPDVDHDVPPERTSIVVVELAFASSLDRRRAFASSGFEKAFDEQAALVEHVSTFAVRETITFVRDARLTTAGLRGSRTARIIERLAALNQVEDDVERLFTPRGAHA